MNSLWTSIYLQYASMSYGKCLLLSCINISNYIEVCVNWFMHHSLYRLLWHGVFYLFYYDNFRSCHSEQFLSFVLSVWQILRFPKDSSRRLQWVLNMKRLTVDGMQWKPTEHDRLCSIHFKPECFNRTGQTVRLRDAAMPTEFNFSVLKVSIVYALCFNAAYLFFNSTLLFC